MANPAGPPPPPVTVQECPEHAAAALHAAQETALNAEHEAATALVEVARTWIDLGITLAQHAALRRDDDQP